MILGLRPRRVSPWVIVRGTGAQAYLLKGMPHGELLNATAVFTPGFVICRRR